MLLSGMVAGRDDAYLLLVKVSLNSEVNYH